MLLNISPLLQARGGNSMETKQVAASFSVSGQLTVTDLPLLQAAGIKTLIGNRPDNEAAGQPAFAELAAQATALGMTVHYLPVVHDFINSVDVEQFTALLRSAPQPIHAWCRSGLRSITLWGLAQVKEGVAPELVAERASQLGFDFKSFAARFASVMAELCDDFAALPVQHHCPVLIIGGGAGGIALAASLLTRQPDLAITVVEPSKQHYYQPGFTMVGAGVFTSEVTVRPTEQVMPKAVRWVQAAVTHFLPQINKVVLNNGQVLFYDRLVVCGGLKLNWGAIDGLQETLGKNGVTSNYLPELAPYTWQLVQGLQQGRAVFTQPPMPIKCAGAPQKALYLSASHWLQKARLASIEIDFYNAGAVLFGVADYVPALKSYIEKYRAQLHFGHNLIKVDGPRKLATFASVDTSGNPVKTEVAFDMLHVCPPQCAPDFMRNSPLADRAGWMDVDPGTLRHKRYANIWGLGDITNTLNAKTAAAVRKQVPVVANNLLSDIRQQTQLSTYDGYGSCPLTVEHGKIVLAEFLYGGKVAPTFPRWLLDGTQPTWLAWAMKKYLLPWLYWNLMLKGKETLAAPEV
jgi:sulfide:quinone oxidoreductase